jgi:ribonuclease P protein component
MRLRFPKAARLTRAPEFARVKRDGVTFPGRYMVFSVLKDLPEAGPARLGIITSRRVGGAVERSAARRRLREIFRAARPRLRDGLWLVLIARQPAGRASFQQLEAEWAKLARRSGILKPECLSP